MASFGGDSKTKKKVVARIFQAWNWNCAYCDKIADTIDHVIPKHLGGHSKSYSNIVPSCKKCNKKKALQSLDVFLKSDPARLNHIKLYLSMMQDSLNNYYEYEQQRIASKKNQQCIEHSLPPQP